MDEMTRHARKSNNPLTERQKTVVEAVKRGLSWTAAAREAGYSDPSGEVDRLKATTAIIDAVVGPLQEKAANWERLGGLAMKVLERHMRDTHEPWCKSHQPPDPEHGWPPCNCPFSKIRPQDANTAAKITTDVLGRTDPDTLAQRARKEDAAMSDEEAARQYLEDIVVAQPN